MGYFPKVTNIVNAHTNLQKIMKYTPLEYLKDMSLKYNCNLKIKREDLTPVRSYKLRGAYNKISNVNNNNFNNNGLVCASAGNHAQGVAYSCNLIKKKCDIFMPIITPKQKIDKVKKFGNNYIDIHLVGNSFDEAFEEANNFSKNHGSVFVHPFDDELVIEGQGTVGIEILQNCEKLDYIFLPIGGGGLASGVSSLIKQLKPEIKVIGVEPMGAASMFESIKQDKVVKLDKINTFVDGAAVKKVGNLNFEICKDTLDKIILIDEGHVCSKILEMYNEYGMIIEPAGVLSLCVLDKCEENGIDIKGKNCVSIISGGNCDVFRMTEIMERSLIYEGLKHYFRIYFPQKAGELRKFIVNILGSEDDIIFFKYSRIINQEYGPVIVGIEIKQKEKLEILLSKMKENNMIYEKLNHSEIM